MTADFKINSFDILTCDHFHKYVKMSKYPQKTMKVLIVKNKQICSHRSYSMRLSNQKLSKYQNVSKSSPKSGWRLSREAYPTIIQEEIAKLIEFAWKQGRHLLWVMSVVFTTDWGQVCRKFSNPCMQLPLGKNCLFVSVTDFRFEKCDTLGPFNLIGWNQFWP